MTQTQGDKAKPATRENANLKPGRPPRPATEPAGAEGSSDSGKTAVVVDIENAWVVVPKIGMQIANTGS